MILLLWKLTTAAWACSCMQPPPAPEALTTADAVVYGEIVEVRAEQGAEGNPKNVLVVDVKARWKGPEATRLEVRTPTSSAACGVTLSAGQAAVVYAYGEPLSTNLCTRTTTDVATEAAALGAPASGAFPSSIEALPTGEAADQAPAPPEPSPSPQAAATPEDAKQGCEGRNKGLVLLPLLPLALRRRQRA